MVNQIPPIGVVIADEHAYYRAGLKNAILTYAQDRIVILGEAANGREAVNLVKYQPPDVILTDMQMPEMDGFEVSRFVAASYSSVSVIALSNFTEERMITASF